tara:strand:+ start:3373 stop:3510 length:138 start_codon:yes stop_codon:yes gene_type:complete
MHYFGLNASHALTHFVNQIDRDKVIFSDTWASFALQNQPKSINTP